MKKKINIGFYWIFYYILRYRNRLKTRYFWLYCQGVVKHVNSYRLIKNFKLLPSFNYFIQIIDSKVNLSLFTPLTTYNLVKTKFKKLRRGRSAYTI